MDDPWGSPWTSTDAVPPPNNSSNNSILLSPPPKAFFGGTSLTHSPGPSPWADDDAFGGWAAKLDPDQSEVASPWATAGRDSPLRTPHLKSKTSSLFDRESTGSWPGSPGLNPPPRSRASSIFRPPPSPDPWAADSPWLDATPRQPPPSADTSATNNNLKPEDVPSSRPGPSPLILSPSKPPEDDEGGANAGTHESPSRPSSTFSADDNGRAPDRQDSPITSIDEDANLRPQQPSARKASGRIALLVDKFDGLARAASEEPVELQRPTSSKNRSKERSRDTPQPAESDEPKSEPSLATAALEAASEALADSDPLRDPSKVSPVAHKPSSPIASLDGKEDSPGDASSTVYARRSASAPVQQLIEKYGPISFDVNSNGFDKLFSGLPDDASKDDDSDDELPDRIISDSFTNLEQRRIWYRISRYGSMRKHNSGDDENYPRIQWATSEVHEATIKVVRRWKEEDSISGKPTFGLGKRTSVFNWDSGDAPIEMDKIFARKSSPVKKSSVDTVTPRDSVEIANGRTVGALPQPPKPLPAPFNGAKAFGWSSTTPKPLSAALPLATGTTASPKTDSARNSISSALAPTVSPKEAGQEPSPKPQPRHIGISSRDEAEDDDDEWGEMVASPTFAKGLELSNGFPDIGKLDPPSPKADVAFAEQLGQTVPQQDMPERKASVEIGSSGYAANVPASEASFSPEQESQEEPKEQQKEQISDPWASADFSHFETPAPQPTQEDQQPEAPIAGKSMEPPVVASASSKLRAIPKLPSSPATVILGPVQSSKKEEQEGMSQAVEDILRNLPDLSYMLR
ncbi:uncharacterized protein PG998_004858 [Apiospora kogelbergensis]|uniref:uncharacterized protein n=1 Tax=Apiospora kogelbergensis TaxID=1337665 RepID=UPI0031315645